MLTGTRTFTAIAKWIKDPFGKDPSAAQAGSFSNHTQQVNNSPHLADDPDSLDATLPASLSARSAAWPPAYE